MPRILNELDRNNFIEPQTGYLLLTYCIRPRLDHLVAAIDPSRIAHHISRFDLLLGGYLERVLGQAPDSLAPLSNPDAPSDDDGKLRALRMCLPYREGGPGLQPLMMRAPLLHLGSHCRQATGLLGLNVSEPFDAIRASQCQLTAAMLRTMSPSELVPHCIAHTAPGSYAATTLASAKWAYDVTAASAKGVLESAGADAMPLPELLTLEFGALPLGKRTIQSVSSMLHSCSARASPCPPPR